MFTRIIALPSSAPIVECKSIMVFEHIERLKHEYTDKSVVVDNGRTDLSRFRGLVGTVITVNMSGRALVQFNGHNDIGRYDIDLDFLKVVDQPVKKTEKTIAKKTKPGSPKEMSVADMLAAARGETGGTKSSSLVQDAPQALETEAEMVVENSASAEPASNEPKAPNSPLPTDVPSILAYCRKVDSSPEG